MKLYHFTPAFSRKKRKVSDIHYQILIWPKTDNMDSFIHFPNTCSRFYSIKGKLIKYASESNSESTKHKKGGPSVIPLPRENSVTILDPLLPISFLLFYF